MVTEKNRPIQKFLKQFKHYCLKSIIEPDREVIPPIPSDDGRGSLHHQQRVVVITTLWPYLWIVLMTLVIMLIGKLFHSVFNLTNIALLYLLPELFAAVFWGLRLSIVASILSVLAFDFFFVPPILTFTVADLKYITVFIVFLLVAFITGSLATNLRNQATNARQRERRTAALYELSSKIAAETEISPILKTVAVMVAETLDGAAFILMPDHPSDKLVLRAYSNEMQPVQLSSAELAVADWTYQNSKAPGKSILEKEKTNSLFLPIGTETKKLGVLVYKFNSTEKKQLSPDQKQLLVAFLNMAAVAIFRLQLAAEAERSRYIAESERLRTALFNSISHDLRTPLSSITGAVTGLLEEADVYDDDAKRDLLQTIKDGAVRLNRLVGNLLDMARLESGMLKLKKEWYDIQDILGVVLRQLRENLNDYKITVNTPPELPLIKVDFSLIEQVLINLLENAAKYTPLGSEIIISFLPKPAMMQINIEDCGPGIPASDRERIFDKFFRLSAARQIGGTGLGLSICKGFVEAHRGRIWVDTGASGGSLFMFTLPLEALPPEQILPEKSEVDDAD